MKHLHLIRHAKTEKVKPNQRDFDRDLTDRGRKQLNDLCHYLKESLTKFDIILVSSAKRTKMTHGILSPLFPKNKVQFLDNLYLASADAILNIIENLEFESSDILLIGHNDGISDLVSYLLNEYQHVPTSGYVHLQLPIEHWNEVTKGCGMLVDSYFSEAL